MFYAITQIASKGIVSMEELRRQLGEKLPGVIQIAAKALNTIPEELEKAIRKGVVSSEKFLPIFGDALIRTFGDSSQKASESVSASINRLTNVWVDFVKAVLDSGAGKSIVNVFDALREKLSDPYLIQRFA
jgi:tape measure domain-containing protein